MVRDALVVGINNYQDRALSPLKSPAEDAEAIAQILETYGEFQVQRFPEAINRGTNKPIVGKTLEVSLNELEDALVKLFKPDSNQVPDTALFYFSGHGIRKNKGIQEGFLCTSDIDSRRGFNGLSLRWLRDLLQESPIKQQIIWLDCCHTGEILNFNKYDPGEQGKARDRCFIAASRSFEVAYEDLGSQYSVLTKVLLKGLDPDRKPQEWITNYSLIEFIDQNLVHENQRPVSSNFGSSINLTRSLERKPPEPIVQEKGDICPYRGLAYFDCNDEDPQFFYGREKLTDKLLDRVRENNFLAILGASGSGKSSVLRAGLLHQLQLGRKLPGSQSWKIPIMLPGEHPLQSLALSWLEPDLSHVERAKQLRDTKSLLEQGSEGLVNLVQADKASRIILAIDQFEEAFTLCQDVTEREAFFQCLLDALEKTDNKLCLILAMRIDFFGKCFEKKYSGLGNKIQDKNNFIAVPPMEGEELERAIIKPAEKVKLSLEAGLTETIIRDIKGSPGISPLLQDTLTELWKRRENTQLKLSAYVDLGGIAGTLNQRATKVYNSFHSEGQEAVRHILLSLTSLGEGTEDTRRRINKQSLITAKYHEKIIDNVVQKLADEKLIVTKSQVVKNSEFSKEVEIDVAHEALIRNWLLLRQWLDGSRDYLRQKRNIEFAAQQWLSNEKNPDYLLQGARLIEAEGYFEDDENWSMLDEVAAEFITKSQNLRTQQEQEEEKRRQEELTNLEARRQAEKSAKIEAEKAQREAEKRETEQRQANRKLRIWSLVAVSFGVAAGFLGIISFFNSQEAQLKKQAADIKFKFSLGNEIERLLESIELVGDNQKFNQRSLKLQTKLIPEVQSILYPAVQDSREKDTFNGHQESVRSVAFSPDGNYIVSGSDDDTLKLWSRSNQSLIHTFNGHQKSVRSVDFSPDGNYIVSGSFDRTLKLWDVANQSLVHTFTSHQSSVRSVAFSKDGNYIVSGSGDNTVKLWDVANQSLVHTFTSHQGDVNSVAFSPDGNYLLSGSDDNTVKLWDVANQSLVHTFTSHQGDVNSVAFSPDGNYLLSGSDDDTVKLWSVANQSLVHTFYAHQSGVNSVAFSPDGNYIVSGSYDRTLKLWSVENQFLVHTFNGHQDWVHSSAFSADGNYIVSGSDDDTLKLWSVKNQSLIHTFNGHQKTVWFVAFSPDGNYIVSGSWDNTLKLWSVKNQSLVHTFKSHQGQVRSVAFSPDGNYIVSGSDDDTLKLWSVANQSLVHTFNGHQDDVYSVTFSPDGNYIVSGSWDNTLKLWSVANQSLVHTFNGHQGQVSSVAFSPDGNYIVSGSWDNTLKLWLVKNQSLVHTFNGHQESVNSVVFSQDSNYIVSGSFDRTLKLWSVKNQSLVHTFNGHQDLLSSVAFSPDGNYLLSGSYDRTLKLWSVKNQSLVHTFNGHQKQVRSVAFSPDGSYIVSGSFDNTVKLWRGLDWQDWLEIGCDRIRLHPALASSKKDSPAPEAAKNCLKYGNWSDAEKAQFFVKQGLALARESGDTNRANKKFRQAAKLDPTNVDLSELEAEANRLATEFKNE